MKKLSTLVAIAVLAVYLMPLVTVDFSTAGSVIDDIYLPASVEAAATAAVEWPDDSSAAAPAPQTAPPTEPETAQSFDERTKITVNISGQTKELTLRDYLIGVVAAEMPASFPKEALMAQALAARTYTLYKLMLYDEGAEIPAGHGGAQLCDDHSHCKAYRDVLSDPGSLWGEYGEQYLEIITDAVRSTDGLIAIYGGKPIAAVFHAASDGYTEAAIDVWGSAVPYLQSVETSGGQESSKYFSTVTMRQSDFIAAFKAHYPDAVFPASAADWFKDSNRSKAGGVIDVAVAGIRVSGSFIRQIAGLNSTNFRLQIYGDDITFTTQGYGHGVGMSQYGARQMALDGASFDQIVTHYFKGTEILLKS